MSSCEFRLALKHFRGRGGTGGVVTVAIRLDRRSRIGKLATKTRVEHSVVRDLFFLLEFRWFGFTEVNAIQFGRVEQLREVRWFSEFFFRDFCGCMQVRRSRTGGRT